LVLSIRSRDCKIKGLKIIAKIPDKIPIIIAIQLKYIAIFCLSPDRALAKSAKLKLELAKLVFLRLALLKLYLVNSLLVRFTPLRSGTILGRFLLQLFQALTPQSNIFKCLGFAISIAIIKIIFIEIVV